MSSGDSREHLIPQPPVSLVTCDEYGIRLGARFRAGRLRLGEGGEDDIENRRRTPHGFLVCKLGAKLF